MGKGGGKRPRAEFRPRPKKKPTFAEEPQSHLPLHPSWKLGSMELVEEWGWCVLNEQQLRFVHNKLSQFETMTWAQILIDGKNSNHSVRTADICSRAQQRLEAMGYGDLDCLTSLRLSGKERVWGVRNEGVLKLLWWDPNHTVYPVKKKRS